MEERLAKPDVAPGRDNVRSGAEVLSLLGSPLNAKVLRAHAEDPLRLNELQRKIDWSAQTSLRVAIATFRDIGVLERREIPGSPYAVENELTAAGREMLAVADVLSTWLTHAPDGQIAPDSDAAKNAIKALVEGWSSNLIRALAVQPLSLTELDNLIPSLSYPSLERRLARMRTSRQVTPAPGSGRGTPYEVTDWLRRSAAPLLAAVRWEQRHLGDRAVPFASVDIQTALLLSLPLVSLAESADGNCLLATQPHNPTAALIGLMAEVRRGRVTGFRTKANRSPPNWALAPPDAWLDVIVDDRLESLRIGGADPQLVLDLIQGIHIGLFSGQEFPWKS